MPRDYIQDVSDQRPMAVAARAKARMRVQSEGEAPPIRALRRNLPHLQEAVEKELRVWSLGLGAGSALMALWGFNSDDPHHLKKVLAGVLAIGALTTYSTAEGAEEFQKRSRVGS